MCATLAGTPSLSARRKSISRYWRLWPPPWCRVVIRPWTFRPPFFGNGRTSDFSGSDRVSSAKSETLAPRRPGVVGLYLRIAISCIPSAHRAAERFDAVAVGQLHQRPLGIRPAAEPGPGALTFAGAVDGVDVDHADVEDLLNSDLDRGLVSVL